MSLDPYRQVLRLPGVARLLVLATLARVAPVASGIVLTLHVVLTLHLGYAAAGLVGTATTVGMAVGAPWRGRAIDRVGLRRALLPSVIAEAVVWSVAPFVGYRMLLLVAVLGGLLGLPLFTAVRQSISVLVPPDQRRPAYTMDSLGVELSFMVGPAAAVLAATTFSTTAAVLGVGAAIVLSGIAMMVLNPPTRSSDLEQPGAAQDQPQPQSPPVARTHYRDWLSMPLLAVFAATSAAAMVLAGTDVAVVAHLRETSDVGMAWLVFLAWGVSSMSGGLVYGAVRRPPSLFLLLLVLALLTVPVGLAPGPWGLALAMLPAGALCAPMLTATADTVSKLVPEDVRGEAMGWHGSSLTLGLAFGAPLAGAAIDGIGSWAGFAAVGVAGLVVAGFGLAVGAGRHRDSPVLVAAPIRPVRDPAATLGD
jgi:predicted MFS family arabinose efflux permease